MGLSSFYCKTEPGLDGNEFLYYHSDRGVLIRGSVRDMKVIDLSTSFFGI